MESEFSFAENARGESMNTSDVSRSLMTAAKTSLHNSSDSTLVSEEVHDENHEEGNSSRDRCRRNKKYELEDEQKLYPSNSAPVLCTSAKQNRSN